MAASVTLLEQRPAKSLPEGRFIERWVIEDDNGKRAIVKSSSEWGEVMIWQKPKTEKVQLSICGKSLLAGEIIENTIALGEGPFAPGETKALDQAWLDALENAGFTFLDYGH